MLAALLLFNNIPVCTLYINSIGVYKSMCLFLFFFLLVPICFFCVSFRKFHISYIFYYLRFIVCDSPRNIILFYIFFSVSSFTKFHFYCFSLNVMGCLSFRKLLYTLHNFYENNFIHKLRTYKLYRHSH